MRPIAESEFRETAEPLALRAVSVEVRQDGGAPLRVLDIPSLDISAGARVALTGPSGAGKTTLLHLLAGIGRPTRGAIRWGGLDLANLTESARDRWRRREIGLVFQDFHLIPELSILDNILLPLTFGSAGRSQNYSKRAVALSERMGLPDPRRRAAVLSRGEQQRVAIARALLQDPAILLADEPTASLDATTGDALGTLLLDAARQRGATLIVVTHDPHLIARLDTVLRIEAGKLMETRP
ncbi:ABC transporter ATP-binding protein [Microvirga terricola]|uniref:ABC transporter ATP-binding protein n=1 Tax=Microvirga terricola TaxID=2719797 RepID=A0ABX0VFQ3_9HYPH|nr:ABC transporter ATP-binding protein [Microvirga terricola]NIX77535.1 ABC transporter ATP-binding protein [Microvirga terricola]